MGRTRQHRFLQPFVSPEVHRGYRGMAFWCCLPRKFATKKFASGVALRDFPRAQAPSVRRMFTFALRAVLHSVPPAGITSERAALIGSSLVVVRIQSGKPSRGIPSCRATHRRCATLLTRQGDCRYHANLRRMIWHRLLLIFLHGSYGGTLQFILLAWVR